MSLNNYIKTLTLSLICMLSALPSAQAQWPTLDISAIFQDAKSITQQVEQYKTQIMESKTVGSINSAIGDAKSSMSKFNTDKIAEAKKKAEKAKKVAEKAKKIKDALKKAKEVYEKEKKRMEEYKKQLDEAKSMASDAMEVASSAGDLAKMAVSDLSSKASSLKDKAGSKISSATGSVSSKVSSAKGAVSNKVSSSTSATSAKSSGAGLANLKNTVINKGAALNASKAVVPSVTSPSQGRVSFTPATNNVVTNKTPSTLNAVKNIAATKGTVAGTNSLQKTLAKAVNSKDIQTLDAVANLDTADIINSDSKIYEEETDGEPSENTLKMQKKLLTNSAAVSALMPVKPVNAASEAEKTSDDVKQDNAVSVQSVDSAVKTLKSVEPVISKAPVALKASAPNALVSQVKANTLAAPQPVSATTAPTVNKIVPTLQKSTVGTNGQLQLNRKTFSTQPVKLDKQSSIWLNDGDRARHSNIKLSYAATLSFASGASECDYNNSIMSGDDGEIVILSETMAKECCINAEELTDLNLIKDCANKLLTKMHDQDSGIAAEAKGLYGQILGEQSKYGLAEALENTNVSTSYQSDVLEQYKEDMTAASTSGDDISTIAETNTQLLYLLNRIRRIYTSALASMAFSDVNSVTGEALDEETEIGLSHVDGEYEASISLSDIEYPVIPENLAKKCLIKVSEGSAKVKECYLQALKEMNAKDFKDAEVGKNYVNNIKYQDTLDVLAKSLYQKVKSAKYDDQLQKTKDKNSDATTTRTKGDGLFNTDYEIQEIIDDINNVYASRIAHTSLNRLSELKPLSTETEG